MSTVHKHNNEIPPMSEERAKEIEAMSDEDIDFSDIPELDEASPYDRHFFNTATDDEWIATFSEWSKGHKSRNLSVLSDEAMS